MIYTFFLGLLLSIFVGVGINTFYTSPERPAYPSELMSYGKEMTEDQVDKEKAFQKESENFDKNILGPYNRNVSIATMAAAVILLAASLLLEKRKIPVLTDGVMLGGLFTLLYSLGRGFAAQDSNYSFIAISIALVTVLYLGFDRFVDNQTKKPQTKHSRE